MISTLYDKFKPWSDGGSVYLYSDPHFNDPEMIYFRDPSYDDIQLRNISKTVHKNDTLIILGDVGDPRYLSDFKFRKILIKGNHDIGSFRYKKFFDEIYEGPLFIAEKILLTHAPVNFPYAINIHGHVHDMNHKDDMYHINCCAEKINYTPISLSAIIKSGALHDISSLNRTTIDRAAEKAK